MGQPITLLRSTSPHPGVLRYEINRSLTGMGHERYAEGQPVTGDRPPDELARRLLARGGIGNIHIYANIITVELSETGDEGIEDIIRELYTYYVPGVEIPSDEELIAQAEG